MHEAAERITQRPRVLLVDDEEPILRSLGRILHYLGCEVDVAHNATDAERHLDRREYTMALVDVVMPGLDGLSLSALMRSRRPDMRVVVISGKSGEDVLTDAFRSGADDFLSKPISPEQLRHLLHRFVWPRSEPF